MPCMMKQGGTEQARGQWTTVLSGLLTGEKFVCIQIQFCMHINSKMYAFK